MWVVITERGGWSAFLELLLCMENELLCVSFSLCFPIPLLLCSHLLLCLSLFFPQYRDSKVSLDNGELEGSGWLMSFEALTCRPARARCEGNVTS